MYCIRKVAFIKRNVKLSTIDQCWQFNVKFFLITFFFAFISFIVSVVFTSF